MRVNGHAPLGRALPRRSVSSGSWRCSYRRLRRRESQPSLSDPLWVARGTRIPFRTWRRSSVSDRVPRDTTLPPSYPQLRVACAGPQGRAPRRRGRRPRGSRTLTGRHRVRTPRVRLAKRTAPGASCGPIARPARAQQRQVAAQGLRQRRAAPRRSAEPRRAEARPIDALKRRGVPDEVLGGYGAGAICGVTSRPINSFVAPVCWVQ